MEIFSWKKHPLYAGVLDLSSLSAQDIDTHLEALPVDDVWGIGACYAAPFCIRYALNHGTHSSNV